MEKTTVSKQKERRPGKEKAPARSMVLQRRETMVSYLFLLPALCFFVGFVIKPKTIIEEASIGGAKFKSKRLFTIMIRWIAPIFLIAILITSVAGTMGFEFFKL